MLTAREDINTLFDIFSSKTHFMVCICCTPSKDMRAYDSAPPLGHLSIRAGTARPVFGVRLIVATGCETG